MPSRMQTWTPRVRGPAVIFAKADWCSHCQKAKPEMERVASMVGSVIPVYAADADQHSAQIQKWGVRGFPTIFFMTPDGQMVEYAGERQAQRIADWTCITSGMCAAGRKWQG